MKTPKSTGRSFKRTTSRQRRESPDDEFQKHDKQQLDLRKKIKLDCSVNDNETTGTHHLRSGKQYFDFKTSTKKAAKNDKDKSRKYDSREDKSPEHELLEDDNLEISPKDAPYKDTSLDKLDVSMKAKNELTCKINTESVEPHNTEEYDGSNLGKILQFIFDTDEEVVSNISVSNMIEEFDRLFNTHQHSVICITRPPCWGKTTTMNILMLYYAILFTPGEIPQFNYRKIPLQVFYGHQGLKCKNKTINFPFAELQTFTYDDRGSKLCFTLDFSSFKGNTSLELAKDFRWAIHSTLEYFYPCLPTELIQKCQSNTCDVEVNHLDLLTDTLRLLGQMDAFKNCDKVLFIDEIDYPLIRIKDVEAADLRRSLDTFIRRVRELDITIVTFGVFPAICDDIMPNNLAKTFSLAHASLKNIFGINNATVLKALETNGPPSQSSIESLKKSANGFTYAGAEEFSLYCFILWKNNKDVYPKDFVKYKSFLLIEKEFEQNEYFVNLASDLLKFNFKFIETNEVSQLRNYLNVLYHAGFLITIPVNELPADLKISLLSYYGSESGIPVNGTIYAFPNVVMKNSLQLFLQNVLRLKLVSKFGPGYMPTVEMEFTEGNQQKIIDRICEIFQCSAISSERDYERQLGYNLTPILYTSYFVINQVPSRQGRLDMILLPRSTSFSTYIIEAKWKPTGTEKELDECCLLAFHQIWTLKYHAKFHCNLENLFLMGIAVSATSIYCSIAPFGSFSGCKCLGQNKEKLCQAVLEAPRLKKFRTV